MNRDYFTIFRKLCNYLPLAWVPSNTVLYHSLDGLSLKYVFPIYFHLLLCTKFKNGNVFKKKNSIMLNKQGRKGNYNRK